MIFGSLLPKQLQQWNQTLDNDGVLYCLSSKPFLVYLNDDETHICTHHVDPLQFTLNYTEYVLSVDHIQKRYSKSNHYLNRFESCFSSPDNRFIVFLSDVEWWSSNNKTILLSLLIRNGNTIVFREKVLILDYPVTVNSRLFNYSFSNSRLYLMSSMTSGEDVFMDCLELSSTVKKSHVVHKKRIKICANEMITTVRRMFPLSSDCFLIQNESGLVMYMVENDTFGPLLLLNKSSKCEVVTYHGRTLIVAVSALDTILRISLFSLNRRTNLIHLDEELEINIPFIVNQDTDLDILKITHSLFLGFRVYILFPEHILVVDLLRKQLCAHLRLHISKDTCTKKPDKDVLNGNTLKDMLVTKNGKEVVFVDVESQSVGVYRMGNEIYSEISLKYLAALVVNRQFDRNEIETLCIPFSLKTFLLS